MATSYTTLLSQVDAAIQGLLLGEHESYTIGSRSVTRLDLAELRKMRVEFAFYAQREQGGTTAHVVKMQRKSQ